MTWELAVVGGLVGIAFILLYIANRGNQESEKYLPIKLIFITLAILFAISSLRVSSLIVQANEDNIGNSTISDNLISITDQNYMVMNWIFYLFIIISALTVLIGGITYLRGLWKGKAHVKY